MERQNKQADHKSQLRSSKTNFQSLCEKTQIWYSSLPRSKSAISGRVGAVANCWGRAGVRLGMVVGGGSGPEMVVGARDSLACPHVLLLDVDEVELVM